MLSIYQNLFKRRQRREYLDDKYRPRKSSLLVWLQRVIFTALLIVIGIFLMLLSNYVYAEASTDKFQQVSMSNIRAGSLLIKSPTNTYQKIPLLHTDVQMNISGMISRSHIKQQFKNTSDNWIEAIYVFPLPETAAVDHMRMRIGERIIEADIKEKRLAKKIYEKAKSEGKKTALVEQERPNMFTNSVANIGPGETIVIEIEYQQTLHYDQGEFSLRFPMAITPRYIPGTPSPVISAPNIFSPAISAPTISSMAISENISFTGSGWAHNTLQVHDASRITPPLYVGANKINPVSLNINLDAGFPLQFLVSRYHPIIKRKNHDIINVTLASGVTPSDRDFELVWSPQKNQVPGSAISSSDFPNTTFPRAAAFNEVVNDEHYQMIMLTPPANGAYNGQPLAREVTYIIDTSGSMYGISLAQAKQSLLMALERLRLHDKFNIIQFNSMTDQVFRHAKFASFENVLTAKQYVKNLQADGGTEMAPALKLALNNSTDDSYIKQIIFLTDGSVGNETALFDIIHKKLGNNRLFTIGIGAAPNSYFMRKAAQFGRGTFTYISDVNEVNEKMTALFSKLESPVMTDISIVINDNIKAEILPKRIPDLYQGEPIILAIKSDEKLNSIKLTGKQALAPWSATLNLNPAKSSKGIATFWARKKIAVLSDSLHEGADSEQVRSDIIDIALTHHLVSKHTSLVAVDKTPSRAQQTRLHRPLNRQALPVNLPHGQSAPASYGQLAQTASSAELNLIFGFSLLMLSLALTVLLRSNETDSANQPNHPVT